MEEYIKESIQILKQLCIWGKIPRYEKQQLKNCTNEIQVDNWLTTFRQRYM